MTILRDLLAPAAPAASGTDEGAPGSTALEETYSPGPVVPGLDGLVSIVTSARGSAPAQLEPLLERLARVVADAGGDPPEVLSRKLAETFYAYAPHPAQKEPGPGPFHAFVEEVFDVTYGPMFARAAFETIVSKSAADERRAIADVVIRRSPGFPAGAEPPPGDVQALADALGQDLLVLADRFRKANVLLEDGPPRRPELRERDGMLDVDAIGADHLERLGARGADLAKVFREGARDRWLEFTRQQRTLGVTPPVQIWRKWFDLNHAGTPVPFVTVLADALWLDVVSPQLERQRCNPPALALSVHSAIEQYWFPALRTLQRAPEGDGAALVNVAGETLATVAAVPGDELALLQRAANKLASLTGHRTIRYLAREGHRRALERVPNAFIVTVEGGLEGFADAIGAKSKKAAEDVREVLRAGQRFERRWAEGEMGGLWTWSAYGKETRGQRNVLEVRLGAAIMPYFAKRHLPRDAQFLVPVVELPPFVGRERDFAPQAAFQFALVRTMVDKRREVVEKGGVFLTADDLARLAATVGLPVSTARRAIERWIRDGDDAPAVLELVEPDRYHLANNATYASARAFIEEAGNRSVRASKTASASAANKRRRRARRE